MALVAHLNQAVPGRKHTTGNVSLPCDNVHIENARAAENNPKDYSGAGAVFFLDFKKGYCY